MKLYITPSDVDYSDIIHRFPIVENLEDSTDVLILPGGLGNFYDLFQAITLKKDVIIYNKDMFYTPVIKNMYEAYQKGYIEEAPSFYINIESDYKEIIQKLEEKGNGKINNGKTR